jgi:predicted nucleotidyltransferase
MEEARGAWGTGKSLEEVEREIDARRVADWPDGGEKGKMGDSILNEIVRRLVEAYHPERIYLFGSHARGEAGPDSDYDLLVVVPDSAPEERRRSRLAYEALWGTGTAADVLVWTRDAFEARLHLRASLPSTVMAEGRLLYAP